MRAKVKDLVYEEWTIVPLMEKQFSRNGKGVGGWPLHSVERRTDGRTDPETETFLPFKYSTVTVIISSTSFPRHPLFEALRRISLQR